MSSTLTEPPIPRPAASALFIDFDGTLVDIAPTPDAVRVAPELIGLLARVHDEVAGALAIVSGRPVEQIDDFLAPLQLTVAGLHGLDRRLDDGRRDRPEDAAEAVALVRPRLVEFVRTHEQLTLEDKELTLVLHYRQAPHLADAARAVAEEAVAAADGALTLLAGKMVFELKPPGHDKGTAIEALMTEPPFVARHPVFLGDDVTDEAGFRSVNALGGTSVLVQPEAGRTSLARYALEDPNGVHKWLERWCSA